MAEEKKKKKGKPMGPGLKAFIKKHKRFPKTPAERKAAGCMTKADKARSRSTSTKPKKKKSAKKKTSTKKKKTGKKKTSTKKKKTGKKKRKKQSGKWVFK